MKRRKWISHMPLWSQLLALATLVLTITISFLLGRDYQKTSQTILSGYVDSSERVLRLELQDLQQFIKNLASYSLQPRYDSTLLRIMQERSSELTEADRRYILEQIRSFYYSRTDITSYELYLKNKDISFGRDQSAQHFTQLSDTGILEEKGSVESAENSYYNAILPPEDKQGFLTYYQSIIRIDTGKTIAVLKAGVSRNYVHSLTQIHSDQNESIVILNRENDLLYTDLDALRQHPDVIHTMTGSEHVNGSALDFDGTEYYVVAETEDRYGMTLISLLPTSVIRSQLNDILTTDFTYGIMAWIVTAILLFMIIKLTTNPLTHLSDHVKTVGNGEIETVDISGGSREICELTENVNDMLSQIRQLIEKNYLSEINEKTSRLAALEAQLNPHYLYNTLQAIGTEALLNDQPQINRMITSLASNLRYTIKGGDLVPLSQEMKYAENYVLLQKMRLEERLQVTIEQEEQKEDPLIPKISVQTLIENAIIHGMNNGVREIHIRVHTQSDDQILSIIVEDDGCGISEEQLAQMQVEFQHFMNPINVGKIGLSNLNSRLHILYQGQASMEIISKEGKGTRIVLQIPILPSVQKEEKDV